MKYLAKLTLALGLLFLITIYIFQDLQWDLFIQNYFYLGERIWFISNKNSIWHEVFYKIPKLIICIMILICIFILLKNIFFRDSKLSRKDRNNCLHFIAAGLSLPLIVSLLKKFTHISCPYDLIRYGGHEIYYTLFESHTESVSGYCFPAGHASGGLSLLSLIYILQNKKIAWGLFIIFSLGMGMYQTFNGAHFVSHFLTTLYISVLLNEYLKYFFSKTNSKNLKDNVRINNVKTLF